MVIIGEASRLGNLVTRLVAAYDPRLVAGSNCKTIVCDTNSSPIRVDCEMTLYGFRRNQRLCRRRDFQRVVRTSCSVADHRLIVYVTRNDLGRTRLGTSVGKRFGPAVQRNRIKRLIRESFRLLQHELPVGLDLLVIARRADRPTLRECRRSLLALTHRAVRKLNKRR